MTHRAGRRADGPPGPFGLAKAYERIPARC